MLGLPIIVIQRILYTETCSINQRLIRVYHLESKIDKLEALKYFQEWNPLLYRTLSIFISDSDVNAERDANQLRNLLLQRGVINHLGGSRDWIIINNDDIQYIDIIERYFVDTMMRLNCPISTEVSACDPEMCNILDSIKKIVPRLTPKMFSDIESLLESLEEKIIKDLKGNISIDC